MSQQINLYEERLRPRHELASGRHVGVAALVLLAGVAAVAVWTNREAAQKEATAAQLQAEVGERQAQLTALAKAVSERRTSPALAGELEKVKETLAARKAAVEQLDSGRLGSAGGFAEIFAGFARQARANPNLWLTGFAVARGGEAIEIRGRTLDAAVLPAYVQRLGSEPAFRGRRFAGLEMLDRELKDEGAAPEPASGKTAAAPPRFVEFVLRSESAVEGPKGPAGGRGQ